jgi:hypothetical protein
MAREVIMHTKLIIVRVITLASLAITISCSSGVVRDTSFTNEINSEFHGIECAEQEQRFKTSTLNCFLDLTTNLKGNNDDENKDINQKTVASNSIIYSP